MENDNLKRRYHKLLTVAPDLNLSKHLGLIDSLDEKSSVVFTKTCDYLYLKFIFYKSKFRQESEFIKNEYIGLPMEINSLISGFVLEEYILDISVVLFFPQLYPYYRPQLYIIEIKNNFNSKVDIHKFYETICNIHNYKEWNYNIQLDKDILDIYISFDKLDYLFEK
jgi:hypothetical protein|tara:strand:- start:241 stop:741 length:501 start_codon:yes stop_codon:yes gene_type:complete